MSHRRCSVWLRTRCARMLNAMIATFAIIGACVAPPAATETPVAAAGDLTVLAPAAIVLPSSAALYFAVVNHGNSDDTLLGISCTTARAVELHQSLEMHGVIRMRAHPEGFAVPAHGRLVLEPGGRHAMVVAPDLDETPRALDLTLHFARAGDVALRVPVVDPSDLATGDEAHS